MLLPLPVKPASAKHPLSAAVPVALPVPELEGHAEHVAEPVSALKVFAAHAVGVPPFEPVYPLSVTQAVTAVEPMMPPVAELGGQPVHPASAGAAALPVAVLKWSAKQAVKGPPSGPVYTAFATHAVPAVEPVKPPVDELVGQRPEHVALPVSALKWSAEQAVGVPPSGPVYPAFATHAVAVVEPVAPPVAELARQTTHAEEAAAAALYLFISHAETLLSLPVKPASAKHLLTAAVPVAMPVPECGGHGLHAAGAEPVTPALHDMD